MYFYPFLIVFSRLVAQKVRKVTQFIWIIKEVPEKQMANMPKTAGGSTYPQGKVREKSGKINAQFANADLSTNLFANLCYVRVRLRVCIRVCI